VDRNTVIATVLIGIIMMVWLYWMAPQPVPESERPELGIVDTAQTEIPPVVESAPEIRRPARTVPTDSVFAGVLEGVEQQVVIATNLYQAVFSSKGGTLVSFTLNEYDRSDHLSPVQLIDTTRHGALGMVFSSPSSHTVDTRQFFFSVDTNRDTLRIVDTPQQLAYETAVGGGRIRKIYTFKPDTYEVGLRIEQENAAAYSTTEGYDLVWSGGIPSSEDDPSTESARTGAYARSGGEVEEITLTSDAFEEKSLRGKVDWVAVKNQFFGAALIPSGETEGAEIIGERTAEPDDPAFWEDYEVSLQIPGMQEVDEYRLYIGPLEYYRLAPYKIGLYGMVDYGYDLFEWMTRPLAKFVFIPIFKYLGRVLPNYGLVIIVLSLLMKVVLYPLTKASYRSMAKMRDLQPQMELIKEKYADNQQKQQEAMMKMYKETGVNPLGGCLPMLLQYPVIIALWQFLPQSIEIRQQGFLWAADLSAPDKILALPFNIPLYGDFVAGFTLLMGLSMIVQMKIQMASTPSNPQTKIFTYVMPVMIFGIFNKFASGLSLYYLCYNVFTALQQQWINKTIAREKEAASNGQGTKRDARAAKKKGKPAVGKRKSITDKSGKSSSKQRTKK
jgi:YidC/Oxa1 family membrane protein insertase